MSPGQDFPARSQYISKSVLWFHMKQIIFILLLLLPLTAHAFSGTVTKVSDGDTFTVATDHGAQRVRIFGIDAPEHGQAFGTAARQDLAALILDKTVEVVPPPRHTKFPRSYDRVVGLVTVGGTDVGWSMISLGDAWAYDDFSPPPSYDDAMAQAISLHIGLWSDKEPLPPWDWRKARRRHH